MSDTDPGDTNAGQPVLPPRESLVGFFLDF